MNPVTTSSATTPTAETKATQSVRLQSLDALRGFDMLLIAGGGAFISLLHGKTGLAWVDAMAMQLEHPTWHGFTFYDFIFPLFLFMAGVSLSFSLTNGLARGTSHAELYRKVGIRMFLLIGLGILYKNAPLDIFTPSTIRYGSVLGRIGLATFFTTVLYLNFSLRGRLIAVAVILLTYYAALFLLPVPGFGAGDLSFEGNLIGWIDRQIMPGRLLQQTYDELALSTQLPAFCLTILGSVAGDILRNTQSPAATIRKLLLFGTGGVVLGLVWNLHLPINKHLWSGSFIALTAGMAFLFLTLFYVVIDLWRFSRWAFFFKVIGMNSLTIYLGYHFIDFNKSSQLLFEGMYQHLPQPWHEVLNALGAFGLVWLFLYFLYRNRIFLKV
jgi:predicted acyltransferase